MERTNNYEIRKKEAQKYFLRYDQQALINKLKLDHDSEYLYVGFIGKQYRIHRKNGKVERSGDGFVSVSEAGFEEVLSIFDLMCHGKEEPQPSGEWALVNSLPGTPRAVGVSTEMWQEYASYFSKNIEKFKEACHRLGGIPAELGDVGFQIPIFGKLSVALKFYAADEEFPAQLLILWDRKSMDYLYYETAFYIMGYLMECIKNNME